MTTSQDIVAETPAFELTACQAVQRLRAGRLSSEALARACLARIGQRESEVCAWAHLCPEQVIEEARQADARLRAGQARGLLHGVPVGIKDIFDTAHYPTEYGTKCYMGRRPGADAAAVERLRAAGAIVLGKTVTTALASFEAGPTRNPLDPGRTPGGSSSGSAAAVAARMVPLAIGSQTAGSVIRPGSFCGIVALKPQFGAISRRGCLMLSESLDHVGLFARTVEDAALLGAALYGPDDADPASGTVAPGALLEAARNPLAHAPRLTWTLTPFGSRASPALRSALAALAGRLDARPLDLPKPFARALEWHDRVYAFEFARRHAALLDSLGDELGPVVRDDLERGLRITENDYLEARRGQALLGELLDEILADCDALVAPAAPDEAPLGLASTGDPVFCSPWTLIGHPSISLPLLAGEHGLPMGVQLVGRRRGDAALLRIAAWLERVGAA